MSRKLQNEDVKSEADITGAGGTASQLINDTKIYVTANSLNKRLDQAITAGDLSGSAGLTVVSKVSSYTAVNTDGVILCDSSGGAFTITLYTAVGNTGKVLKIKKTDTSLIAVTIDGDSSETIDNTLTKKLSTLNESIDIVSNGTNWKILSRSIPSDWVDAGLTTSDFTGFGTVSSISSSSKREGPDLIMRVKFNSGTATATEARINLKYTSTTLTSKGTAANDIPSIQIAGNQITNGTGLSFNFVLKEPSVSYVTFGVQSSGRAALNKVNGSTIADNTFVLSYECRVPIVDWEG